MAQLFGFDGAPGGGKPNGGAGDAAEAGAAIVSDGSTETFARDVIAASREVPVVVDFWAEWCGPCKQLAPALEKHVRAANGKVRLVKIDIDKNQMLAREMRIQSIPAVYAFWQGQPVDGFMGAVPESEIKAFVERLTGGAGPAPAVAEALDAADAAFDGGDIASAAQAYGEIAQADPGSARAIAGLARCYVATRAFDEARSLLEQVPAEMRADPAIVSVEAALKLAEAEHDAGDLAPLRAKVAENPADHQARFDLACALIGAGDMEAAMDALLEIIAKKRDWNGGAAREKLITTFDALGPKNPLVSAARRKLSSILFS